MQFAKQQRFLEIFGSLTATFCGAIIISKMSDSKRLFGYIKPYKGRLILAFVCMLFFSLFSVVSIWTLMPIIDKLFAPSEIISIEMPLTGWAFTLSRLRAVWYMAGFVVTVVFLKGLAGYGQSYLMSYIGHRTVLDLRNELYRRLTCLDLGFYSRWRVGEIISRLTNDINVLQEVIPECLAGIVREPLTIIAFLVFVFWLSPGLAIISLVIFPPVAFLIRRFGRRIHRVTGEAQGRIAGVTSILEETLSGIRIVYAFNMERYEREKFLKETKKFFFSIMRMARAYLLSGPTMEFLGGVGIAVIILYAGYQVRGNSALTAGKFVAFLGAAFSLYAPIKNLTRVNNLLQRGSASAGRLFEIIDETPKVADKGVIKISGLKKGIEFRNVCFGYDKEREVLADVSFEIKTGQMLAVVGKSGAGKTTLVNLILRFYDVTDGAVIIDGVDIRDTTLRSLREQIGLVTQEVILFNDTVRNNIAYGNARVSEKQVEDAARASHSHEFIMKLPGGYDAVVGDRGEMLSGGQRQRIAIARAILKNPPLLILDEATSSLDSESELLVQQALKNLMRGRTVLVIAHRLSTIQSASRIIVLDGGAVVELGTHRELLEKQGLYSRLYETQFKGA